MKIKQISFGYCLIVFLITNIVKKRKVDFSIFLYLNSSNFDITKFHLTSCQINESQSFSIT